jgi:hypothetical protein
MDNFILKLNKFVKNVQQIFTKIARAIVFFVIFKIVLNVRMDKFAHFVKKEWNWLMGNACVLMRQNILNIALRNVRNVKSLNILMDFSVWIVQQGVENVPIMIIVWNAIYKLFIMLQVSFVNALVNNNIFHNLNKNVLIAPNFVLIVEMNLIVMEDAQGRHIETNLTHVNVIRGIF